MKLTTLTIVICLIFASCMKYLDKKPSNALSTPETIPDLQALLDNASNMNLSHTPSLPEASSDDYFLLESTYSGTASRNQDGYIWNLYDIEYTNDWSFAYTPIYIANLALESIENIDRTDHNRREWDNVKGSALFYRAYYFLCLAWEYAKGYDELSAENDLGIVLRLGADFNEKSIRSSVKDSYDQIIEDTKTAAMLLPELPQHVMRPSRAACYGLLARGYLSMHRYDSALKYSSLCLELNDNLMNFNASNEDVLGINLSVPFRKFNRETIFYTEMGTYITSISTSRAKMDTLLYESYHINDLRRKAFFAPNQGYHKFKGSYAQSSTRFFTGIATDEIFLSLAECLARTGKKESALQYLNQLLRTRWDDSEPFPEITAATDSEALEIILTERRKELLMRGLRWADIKRLNKENKGILLKRKINDKTYQLLPNANYYALKIPIDVIQRTNIDHYP